MVFSCLFGLLLSSNSDWYSTGRDGRTPDEMGLQVLFGYCFSAARISEHAAGIFDILFCFSLLAPHHTHKGIFLVGDLELRIVMHNYNYT